MSTKLARSNSTRSTENLKDAAIITLEEFQKHDKINDCWIQIEDMIFDVSDFMHTHPGGLKVMLSLGGRDATFPFQMNHSKEVWKKYLSSMFVGYLEPSAVVATYKQKKYSPVPDLVMSGYKPSSYDNEENDVPVSTSYDSGTDSDSSSSSDSSGKEIEKTRMTRQEALLLADYRKLWKRLDMDGYFLTDYSYYYRKAIVLTVLFLGSLLAFYFSTVNDSCLLGIAASFGLGLFWQQLAFIGHDMAHNGVTHNNFWDCLPGMFLGNTVQGISTGWWKYTHNVHHIRTNDVEFDPDIQHMPLFAITKEYLDNVYSLFHDRVLKYDAIAKVFIRYQHWLFVPVCLVARVNLTVQSLIYCIWTTRKNPNQKWVLGKYQPYLETITLLLYFCWAYPLFYNTHHPVLYWFVSHVVAGILHIQIVINHFPCPGFHDMHPNFFIHQLQSTIDISSNRYTDWFFGGLQYQLEHHLFPNMPRHNLKKIKPMIQQLCLKHGYEYKEANFFEAVRLTFVQLQKVAEAAEEFHLHTY